MSRGKSQSKGQWSLNEEEVKTDFPVNSYFNIAF
jgi:hypothetical protein